MDKTKNTSLKGVLILLTTGFIWGTSFVAQSIGMEKIDAFTYNGIRTVMGGIVLVPVIIIMQMLAKKKNADNEGKPQGKLLNKTSIKYGLILGILFCIASNFQQFAFYYSTAGKIAFITSLYMFFVPIIGLFIKKKVPLLSWICVICGFIGLYFICINPEQIDGINKGDILTLICAFFYAIHILCVEKFANEVDGTLLSCMQFFVGGGISIILMFIFETPIMADILAAGKPLLYSGIMSCGVAYTFQIIGQKYTEATIASLLMCTESVFAVIAAAIILNEYLTTREAIGCTIVFIAVIISQLPTKKTQS
ncbi:MAG: DMT family transporter [Lachnospiraceae bacterium]|nr:DMT family transporter [Lachnospiraceae bacterium]